MAIRSPERAWARASVAPQTREYRRHRACGHRVDVGRALPVAQLAQVEVAGLSVESGDALPAEEDVAGCLHQPLAGHHPLPVVGVLALADEALQDRRLGLLRLQEQRVLAVAAEQQQDPGTGADAADADDLAGHVDVLELLEQHPAVGLQSPPVGTDQLAQLGLEGPLASRSRREVLDRNDQRWVRDDAALAVDLGGQLRERLHAVPGPGLGQVLRGLGLLLASSCCLCSSENSFPTSMWAYHTSRLRIAAACAIRARYSATPAATIPRRAAGSNPRSRPAISKLAASRLTSHSQGPGSVSSKSLMSNIVLPLRGREHAEVRQVRVTADLRVEPGTRRGGQVGGHDQRRAAVERERRDQHPAVPDRDQLGDPAGGLLLEQRDGVGSVRGGLPATVTGPGDLVAGGLAPSHPLLGGEVGDLPRGRGPSFSAHVSS